jgi:hypothetical protein
MGRKRKRGGRSGIALAMILTRRGGPMRDRRKRRSKDERQRRRDMEEEGREEA